MHVSVKSSGDDKTAKRNKNCNRDVTHAIGINRYFLKSIGLWPVASRRTDRCLQRLMIVLGNLVLGFGIIPCSLHMIYEQKDTGIRLKLFGLLSFCGTNVMKYCALVIRRPGISRCVENVKNDWQQVEEPEDREVMLRYAAAGRSLTLICICFMYSGGVIYHLVLPLKNGKIVNEYNETIKPLAYPIYYTLFDIQNSPAYELVYLLQCMCGYTMYTITSGACGLAAIFAMHACGQIEILMQRLKDLIDRAHEKDKAVLNRKIARIIEHHLEILRFLTVVEEVLQEVCFVEFVGSTFMICLLEYYCLTDWEIGNTVSLSAYGLLLVSFSFNIFILCYIGERLMEQTGQIGSKYFMTDWYLMPPKVTRGFILLIAVSNNPVKLTAGQMADLSLSTFGNVLKTSVAYLSFLRTLL